MEQNKKCYGNLLQEPGERAGCGPVKWGFLSESVDRTTAV